MRTDEKLGYAYPEPSDPVHLEVLIPRLSMILCTRCGVRLWQSDLFIHTDWHKQLEDTTNAR